MTLTTLSAVVLAFMQSLVPESEHARCGEAPAVTHARYEAFAHDVADVAIDEDPLPGLDTMRSALVVANVAARESFYRRDVMNCERHGLGNSWGALQFQGPRVLVCGSWRQALRVGMGMMRESFARCAGLPVGDLLSIYTDGVCWRNWHRSRVRVLPALSFVVDAGDAS